MPLAVQAALAILYGLAIAAIGLLFLAKGVPAGVRRYREGGLQDRMFGFTTALGSATFGLFAIVIAINFLIQIFR